MAVRVSSSFTKVRERPTEEAKKSTVQSRPDWTTGSRGVCPTP